MDDFVLNVRQVGQYPRITSTGPGDVLLVQQNGAGGLYASISVVDAVATALLNGTSLQLNPNATIAWDGATLAFQGGGFFFNKTVIAPAFSTTGNISAGSVTVAGSPVVSQALFQQSLDAIVNNTVLSFNGRHGVVQLMLNDILRAGGAPITNPHFSGWVTAPTPWNPESCDDTVATTAFVQKAICTQLESGHVVLSYNGRGGHVVPIADDVTAALTVLGEWGLCNTPPSGDVSKRIANTAFVDDALFEMSLELRHDFTEIAAALDEKFAPLDSPQFTGIPTGPTAAQTVNSGQLATTAFVHAAVTASTTGVSSFNTRTGAVVLNTADVTSAGGAPINAPAFTGLPTAPTATPGTNNTQIATTAFVAAAVAGVTAGVTSFNTRTGAVVLTTADVTAVGGALLASPVFTGDPHAPTPTPGDNDTSIATTAFVANAIAGLPAPVTSFNGRTGAITFQASDVSAVGGALLAGPAFTGVPTAPTAIVGTSNTQIATTAFVQAAVSAVAAGVTSFNTRTGAVSLTGADVTAAGGALLAGPTFTGVPSAPTATAGTNTTQLATTAFVQQAITASTGVASFNGRTGTVTFQASDISAVGGALLASPAFSGNPTAPTQAPGDNDTSIATTAFVQSAIAAGGGVTSFNGRAGVVTLTTADINACLNPNFTDQVLTGNAAGSSRLKLTTQTGGPNFNGIIGIANPATALTSILLQAHGTGTFNFQNQDGAATHLVVGGVANPTTDWINIVGAGTGGPTQPQINTASGARITFATGVDLTNNPTAPTQPSTDNSTRIATTAFATARSGRVLLIDAAVSGTSASINFAGANAGFDVYEIDTCLFTSAGTPALCGRISTDGGATFWSGATDYHTAWLIASSDATGAQGGAIGSFMQFGVGNSSGVSFPHQAHIRLMWPTASFVGMFRQALSTFGQYSGARNSEMQNACTLAATGAPWTHFLLQWNDSSAFGANSRWKIWGCK